MSKENFELDSSKLEQFNKFVKTKTIGKPKDSTNEFWKTIDSTNNRLAKLAGQGVSEGCTVISRAQSSGRGRLGRQWVSNLDSGLYFSTLLRPQKPVSELPVITLCLGVATRRAVLAICGVELGLKWVNDLIYSTKKVGGILVEMPSNKAGTQNGQALVVGIGININAPETDLPHEVKDKALFLNDISDTTIDTASLAAELCFQIEEVYEKLLADQSDMILDEWRASSVTLGAQITTSNQEITGKAIDIDNTGALIVQTKSGKQLVHAGEISVRSADGSYSY